MNRYAVAIALLLLTPPPASAAPYRMLVNDGVGWTTIGDYPTQAECAVEAATYAAKYSVQVGCAAVGAVQDYEYEKQFQSVASTCASRTGVRITLMPGATLDYLGTTRQQFEFRKCMTDNGHPLSR
jgi:hypothetical protein